MMLLTDKWKLEGLQKGLKKGVYKKHTKLNKLKVSTKP
jgi:hypothetical protein